MTAMPWSQRSGRRCGTRRANRGEPFSRVGEGFSWRFRHPPRIGRHLIPSLPTTRIIPRIPSPRGGRPEACRLAGWVRRLRPGLQPGPGRLREPTWGYYGPCARSSLAGPAADREPLERRRDDPMRGTGEGDERDRGKVRMKRGPEFSNRRRRSATGRADGGSIHPRRFLAQWKRITNQRLAALRCPSDATTPAGRACGRGDLMRHSRPKRSAEPRISGPVGRIRAPSGLRCSGQARA